MKTLFAAAVLMNLASAAMAAEIKVTYAPAFAEELAEEYGLREGEYLTERVRRDVATAFAERGIDAARVEVEILDAKPSKPTFKQGADTPGLDLHRSVGLGGMDLKGVAYDASGQVIGELAYNWYETDIRQAGLTTWQDARRASSRFATKFARTLD